MIAPALNTVIPFSELSIDTEHDRVSMPFTNPNFDIADVKVGWDPMLDLPRTNPSTIVIVTLERTPDGWRRIR